MRPMPPGRSSVPFAGIQVPAPPRILLLVTLAEAGGAQTYVATLTSSLIDRFDVTVAAHGDGPLRTAATAAGATFVPLRHVRRAVSWRDVLGLVELVLLIRRLRPHIVHASSSKAGVLGRVAAWLARAPIRVFTVHGWAHMQTSGPHVLVYRWAERLVRPLTTLTICVSAGDQAAGIAARTCDEHATVVVRNAIDPAARPVARPATEPPRIAAVGRLQAPKDPLTLVRALALLRERSFQALLVGEGVDRLAVQDEVVRLGLTDTVELAGERDDVAAILAASQLFVLSSRAEALPISVLEAMAAGLPVVASHVGGVPELVHEGETGLLVPPGDPAALARAIARLIDDPTLRVRLGAAGRARAEAEFDVERFRAAHLALYRRELAHRGLPLPSP
jgi:glycosyltransferase involved in cell wall biosynthesis